MADRATDRERASREAEALQLLASGYGTAHTAATLAARHSVSLRQARRYVAAASFELVEPATPHSLDTSAMISLHRLDLISGQAMEQGDHALAVRATKAHASALAQYRRAITAPVTRFRLQASRSRVSPDDPVPDELPF